ncbi:uncharacterized protein RCC_10590 [Ramularia collo-cygni]|uniref:N-acetyltransferase domain-containing protein n=1 Tax=Ramularia collo-cygni TaxID=112498 RepID=A0A2D3VHP7_9PEZI|nr:uncharacterized protein RCC_10590 [Ramularia collo-cygni]CZT24862.1 uncharacterized protein RCC_10590 [Ramularia collo-cygni]
MVDEREASLPGELPLDDIVIELHRVDCEDDSCSAYHPNIKTSSAVIRHIRDQLRVGHIHLHTLDKGAMQIIGPSQMMQESQAYDEIHLGAQMNKVENFLENESFLEGRDVQVATAQTIVFVEEVWLCRESRGKGTSLVAVQNALRLLPCSSKALALLQPGSTDSSPFDPFEAEEKLIRHWAKLGFEVWSDSDPAWLCLSLEVKVHGLKVPDDG